MTPDELRALADALEPMARAPRFEDFDVPAFVAWLRQCAEQQPVAWRTFDGEGNYDFRDYESNENYMDDYIRRNGERYASWVEPLYAAPAPTAQRELSDEQIIPDDLKLQFAATAASRDVLIERRRQIEAEGWTPEHDDAHIAGELAAAGASYAEVAADVLFPLSEEDADYISIPPPAWPWDKSWWKPGDPRRNLVKAGALILAEIERLDRMGGSDAE